MAVRVAVRPGLMVLMTIRVAVKLAVSDVSPSWIILAVGVIVRILRVRICPNRRTGRVR